MGFRPGGLTAVGAVAPVAGDLVRVFCGPLPGGPTQRRSFWWVVMHTVENLDYLYGVSECGLLSVAVGPKGVQPSEATSQGGES